MFENMEPARPLYYFEKIASMPHGSKNTKTISDYVTNFAESRNLKYIQDDNDNVIVFKDAYPGYEHYDPVILQGHIDMVCEKEDGCDIDFEKEGLRLVVSDAEYNGIKERVLTAEGTTLGADDGVAVSYMLSLLEDKELKSPALECVFTSGEEIGMLGASALDMSPLRGRRMINLDNGEEGFFLAGCAGGITAVCHLPIKRETKEEYLTNDYLEYCLEISGLTGGHSGEEIIRQRANANVLLGRLLNIICLECDIKIVNINGGLKDNAIPRSSKAVFYVNNQNINKIQSIIAETSKIVKSEFETTDPEMDISFYEIEDADKESDSSAGYGPLTDADCKRAITALYCLPGGIQKMSVDIDGLVQTSLNMGILSTSHDEITYSFSVRSAVASEKEELKLRLECLMNSLLGYVLYDGDYPAWEYKKDSDLAKKMIEIYEEMFGKKPNVGTIHAGLECGIFFDAIKDFDCVSIGPQMYDIHTPEETLVLSSFLRCYNYLRAVLERVK